MEFQSTKLYILIKGKTGTLYMWQRVVGSCKLAHVVIYFTNIKASAYQRYCSSYYYLTGYKEARMKSKEKVSFYAFSLKTPRQWLSSSKGSVSREEEETRSTEVFPKIWKLTEDRKHKSCSPRLIPQLNLYPNSHV